MSSSTWTRKGDTVSSRILLPFSRRELLCGACNGIGALALARMFADDANAATADINPLAVKPQHLPRKAKHCIFLFMAGGVSQLDTFDYKPSLQKYGGQRLPKVPGLSGEIEGFLSSPHRAIPSPFEFKKCGQSGRWMSTLLPKLGECVDDLAFIYG